MRISDWSSDVGSSDLVEPLARVAPFAQHQPLETQHATGQQATLDSPDDIVDRRIGPVLVGVPIVAGDQDREPTLDLVRPAIGEIENFAREPVCLESCIDHRIAARSEEHTSELQSLMRISYAVFCLKKQKHNTTPTH